ncbi:MAG TPA: hypothetical protein PLL95_16840 [Anaerolineales bacterium]|nr:hypothetical protein [Anaerolineales bacterium]
MPIKTVHERLTKIWMKIPKPYFALAKLAANYDSRWRRGADILYLGDSVVERISWHDTDKRTLDQMTADFLPNGIRLMSIARAAYHFRIYYHLLNVLQSMRNRPQLVILPINMRCFSPQWDLNPSWQFEEEIQYLKAYSATRRVPAIRINAEALTFSEAERNLELDLPFTDMTRIWQFLDLINNTPPDPEGKFQRRRQIYIFHYLNALRSNHRRLQDLARILDLLDELNIQVLMYSTPVNYQGAIRHVGEGFVDGIRGNMATLLSVIHPYLREGQVCFFDLQEYLTSDDFFHVDEMTEHLNQSGRLKLAQRLASEIKEMMKNKEDTWLN